ncbi:phosphopantetheine-binding protein [Armatimonas sp.]|uniref:phosphopantetheine-binding protein n=1 Tax=Armatimonas sp. TaxID=1872638 RepID=UPI00375333B1
MIERTIQEIIVERLELPVSPEEIGVDAPLFWDASQGGLGLDSLSSLELLAGLSERFGLPMEDVETQDFRSIQTLADYLRRHGIED